MKFNRKNSYYGKIPTFFKHRGKNEICLCNSVFFATEKNLSRAEVKLSIWDCHSLESTLLLDYFYQIFLLKLHEVLPLNSSRFWDFSRGQGESPSIM